jgi:flagellar hook-length control protein FliK
MEIQKTSAISPTILDPKSLAKILPQLQPGFSVNAVVTSILSENSVVLKLSDGQLLRAQTPNMLVLGQVLKLEVVKSGALPELKIVVPPQAVNPEVAVVQQALRQFLPKQQNLADFAVSLRQFAAQVEGKSDPVSTAVHQVFGTINSKEALMTPEGLKQGISNSGVFLEAKLANQLPPQGDMKAQLLTLADALQQIQGSQNDVSTKERISPALGQGADAEKMVSTVFSENANKDNALLNKTEGAIARIVLDQLTSLPQNDEQQHTWQIEIPYTNGDRTETVKLKINREANQKQSEAQANWSVLLELNPPGLGALQSRISLVDDKIDTLFWSDQAAVASLVQHNLDHLANGYAEAGLSIGRLDALHGSVVSSKSEETSIHANLLDEHI